MAKRGDTGFPSSYFSLSVMYHHGSRPPVTKFPCKLSCSHLQEYLKPCQVWDTSNIYYFSVPYHESFLCIALLRVPPTIQTLLPVSKHGISRWYWPFLAEIFCPALWLEQCHSFSVLSPLKKHEMHICVCEIHGTPVSYSWFCSNYPLIYCLRTANFNSDYFYCCSRFFSPSYSTTPFSCTWPFPHSHCHTSKAIACYKWNWNLGSELWCLVVNLEYSFQEVQSHKVKVLSFPLGTLMLLLRIHITKLNVPLRKHCTVRLIKNKNNRINLPCK